MGCGWVRRQALGCSIVLWYSAGAGTVDVFVAGSRANVQPACTRLLLALGQASRNNPGYDCYAASHLPSSSSCCLPNVPSISIETTCISTSLQPPTASLTMPLSYHLHNDGLLRASSSSPRRQSREHALRVLEARTSNDARLRYRHEQNP